MFYIVSTSVLIILKSKAMKGGDYVFPSIQYQASSFPSSLSYFPDKESTAYLIDHIRKP